MKRATQVTSFHFMNSCCGLRLKANDKSFNGQPQLDFDGFWVSTKDSHRCTFQLSSVRAWPEIQPQVMVLDLGSSAPELLPAVGCWACTAAWWTRGTWPRSPGRWCTGSGCPWSPLERNHRWKRVGEWEHKHSSWLYRCFFPRIMVLGLWYLGLGFSYKDLLFVSSCAAYLVNPLRSTCSPSSSRKAEKAGDASSLLYISSSVLWPARHSRTPTLCFWLNYKAVERQH